MSVATALHRESFASVHTDARSCSFNVEDRTKAHLITLLAAAGCHELAVRVSQCCSEFRALECENGHRFKHVPTSRCRYRLCVDCARERQHRALKRLWPMLRGFQRAYPHDRPVVITLTIKSSHEPLAVIDKRFKGWFSRLRRSEKWKHRIRAAVAGFEFTWSAVEGWHYHAHILAYRKAWYEQAELAAQWQRITKGAGQIVDIQSKGNLRTMASEVLKYCFKPSDIFRWDVQQVREFNALRRIKLSECYGELRGLKVETDDDLADDRRREHEDLGYGSPCPDCGEPLYPVTVPRSLVPDNTS